MELLKARTAVGLGFPSVEHWEDQTTPEQRHQMMALAWIDGWGVGWKYVYAKVHNVNCTKSEDTIDPHDAIKPPEFVTSKPECDWSGIEAMFRNQILKGR